MKKVLITLIIFIKCAPFFAQNDFKVGDTIYYQDNRFSYYKTATFVILKKKNVDNNFNYFNVDKYQFDKDLKKPILESNFTSIGLAELRTQGLYTEFFKNGNKSVEGETIEGKRSDGIWTYYYENGQKKSEEKIYKNTILKKVDDPLIMSFWDKKGNQIITDGNGTYEFTDENNITLKGTLKEGFRNGTWIATRNDKKVYEEKYKNGKLLKGASWDETGKKYSYKKINIPASFKAGGIGTVRNYVVSNFNENIVGVSGSLTVSFNIDKKGVISNIKIIQPLSASYNNEVERIIKTMQGWKPAELRGQPIDFLYTLSLNFK